MLKNQKQILKTKKEWWFYTYKIITDLNRVFKVIILMGKNSICSASQNFCCGYSVLLVILEIQPMNFESQDDLE